MVKQIWRCKVCQRTVEMFCPASQVWCSQKHLKRTPMEMISGEPSRPNPDKKTVKPGPVKESVVESSRYKVSRVTNPQELADLLKGLL
jgi:hypothetical protein